MPQDITAFFERYRDAFNRLDGEAVAGLYAEPSGIAQDGRYTHWPSRPLVAKNMVALCEHYRARGFEKAEFEVGQVIDQGEQFAIADVHWRIHWARGQAPWDFGTTYNLVRGDEGWKVLLCTAYSEPAR